MKMKAVFLRCHRSEWLPSGREHIFSCSSNVRYVSPERGQTPCSWKEDRKGGKKKILPLIKAAFAIFKAERKCSM